MNEFIIVSLILLGIIALDSSGDAFRIHQWQNIHHLAEAIGVATWIFIWASFEFRWEYILMYVTARICFFDPLLNIIAGYRLTYSGKSSFYGRALSWFQTKVKEPGMLIWVIRGMSLAVWVAYLIKTKG